jgi:hypothetical protein
LYFLIFLQADYEDLKLELRSVQITRPTSTNYHN